jgi:hypothetical protein
LNGGGPAAQNTHSDNELSRIMGDGRWGSFGGDPLVIGKQNRMIRKTNQKMPIDYLRQGFSSVLTGVFRHKGPV